MEGHPATRTSWDENSEWDYLGSASEALSMPKTCFQSHKLGSLFSTEALNNIGSLPPCLIQVGDLECLYGPAMEYSNVLQAAGVDLTLEVTHTY
eukprot:scaffold187414_cov34-Prasinocladus_malaysianus.AAC.1